MSLRPLALLCLPAVALAAPPGGDLPTIADKNPKDGSLRVWGQAQTWITVMDEDLDPVADVAPYGDPEHDPGFTLQRGRLGATGMLPRTSKLFQANWGVGFGVGAPYDLLSQDTTDVQIVDAMGQLVLANDFGPTAISVGVQKVPFSRDQLQSTRDLSFQERAVTSNHLGHGRDAGAILSQGIHLGDDGELGQVAVRLGAFNGNEDFLGDEDPGLLLAARAELAIGRAYQTFDPRLKPALGVAANLLHNDELATNTTRYGGDLLGRYKWFTATGEVILGTIAPGDPNATAPGVSETIAQMGWCAQLSFFLPMEEEQGGPELAGRFATFDDDTTQDDLGDVQILHAGLNWHGVVPHVDAGAGYVLRMEGGTLEVPNNTVRMWIQFRPSYDVL